MSTWGPDREPDDRFTASEKSEIDHRPRPIRWIAAGVIAIGVVAAVVVLRDPSPPDSPATIAEGDAGEGDAAETSTSAEDTRQLTEFEQSLLEDPIRDRFSAIELSSNSEKIFGAILVQDQGPVHGPYGSDDSWTAPTTCPELYDASAPEERAREARGSTWFRFRARMDADTAVAFPTTLDGGTAWAALVHTESGSDVTGDFDGHTAQERAVDGVATLIGPTLYDTSTQAEYAAGLPPLSIESSGRTVEVSLAAVGTAGGSLHGCVPPNVRDEVDSVTTSEETEARAALRSEAPEYETQLVVTRGGDDYWALVSSASAEPIRAWIDLTTDEAGDMKITPEGLCELARSRDDLCRS